jgi:hypothetical protein
MGAPAGGSPPSAGADLSPWLFNNTLPSLGLLPGPAPGGDGAMADGCQSRLLSAGILVAMSHIVQFGQINSICCGATIRT